MFCHTKLKIHETEKLTPKEREACNCLCLRSEHNPLAQVLDSFHKLFICVPLRLAW